MNFESMQTPQPNKKMAHERRMQPTRALGLGEEIEQELQAGEKIGEKEALVELKNFHDTKIWRKWEEVKSSIDLEIKGSIKNRVLYRLNMLEDVIGTNIEGQRLVALIREEIERGVGHA